MIDSSCEVIWVQIHSQNHCSRILGLFCCPPQSPVSVWDDLALCVSQLRQRLPDIPLLLGGDFNCPGIDWGTSSLTELYLLILFRESLVQFAHDFLLEQIILEPTRGDNILDLCFTSHPASIHHYKTVPNLSDHDAIIIETFYNIPINKRLKKRVYCYNRANWEALCETEISRYHFEQNENNNRSVEDNWNYIQDNLLKAINTYIPVKFISNSNNGPWMTSQLKRLIRKKQRCYNKAKRSKRSTDWVEYKSIQGQVRQSICNEHQNYITNIFSSSSNLNGNKPFWHYIKS